MMLFDNRPKMSRSPFWNDQSSFCLAFHKMVDDRNDHWHRCMATHTQLFSIDQFWESASTASHIGEANLELNIFGFIFQSSSSRNLLVKSARSFSDLGIHWRHYVISSCKANTKISMATWLRMSLGRPLSTIVQASWLSENSFTLLWTNRGAYYSIITIYQRLRGPCVKVGASYF